MPRVLFLQHGPLDYPGLFAEVLAKRGIELETVHPWRSEAVPSSLDGFEGFALSGGEQSAYEVERYPYFTAEMELVREAATRATPTLGMCLGAQLMAAALGATVRPGTAKEIGFFPVDFTPAGLRDPLWQGAVRPFIPAHWHGDVFTLPEGAVSLASSALTEHQLFVVNDVLYALQFHLEMTAPILQENIEGDPAYLFKAGVDPAALIMESPARFAAVEATARTVFHRWADLLRQT